MRTYSSILVPLKYSRLQALNSRGSVVCLPLRTEYVLTCKCGRKINMNRNLYGRLYEASSVNKCSLCGRLFFDNVELKMEGIGQFPTFH